MSQHQMSQPPMSHRAAPGSATNHRAAPGSATQEPGNADPDVDGQLRISESTLAKLAGRLVTEVPNASVSGSPVPGRGGVRASIDGPVAALNVRMGVRWPASVPGVSAEVRDQLRRRLGELTGLTIDRVDIAVTDLVTEVPSGPRVR